MCVKPIAANDNVPPRTRRPFQNPPAGIDALLDIEDVRAATRLGRSTIYRRIDAGTFPKPICLSPGCVRWRVSAITAWLDALEQKPGTKPGTKTELEFKQAS